MPKSVSLFTFHFSLFTFHFSLLTFHFSLFTFHFSLFTFDSFCILHSTNTFSSTRFFCPNLLLPSCRLTAPVVKLLHLLFTVPDPVHLLVRQGVPQQALMMVSRMYDLSSDKRSPTVTSLRLLGISKLRLKLSKSIYEIIEFALFLPAR